MSKGLNAGRIMAERVFCYMMRDSGNLDIFTTFPENLSYLSRIYNTEPDGPLKLAIEHEGYVLVPGIISEAPQRISGDYILRNKNNKIEHVAESKYPFNQEVIKILIERYWANFERSGQDMSMVYGCLSFEGKVFGAFKADCFGAGTSIHSGEMDIEEFFSYVAIIGDQASASLNQYFLLQDLSYREARNRMMYDQLKLLCMGLTHDVKNRMSPPQGTADILGEMLQEQYEEAEELELIKKIQQSFRKIHETINKWGRLINSKDLDGDILISKVNVAELIQSFAHLRCTVKINNPCEEINTNEAFLSFVLLELVANAQKYSDNAGSITLEVSSENTYICFKVINSKSRGQQNCKDGFNQGQKAVGLIVEKMGGRFLVEDKETTYEALVKLPV